MPDKSGLTVRHQLEGVYKKTKKKPILLEEEVLIPQLFKEVYTTFIKLKSQDLMSNISHSQLLTYQQLFDVKFLKLEIDIFSNLDIIFNKIYSQRNK